MRAHSSSSIYIDRSNTTLLYICINKKSLIINYNKKKITFFHSVFYLNCFLLLLRIELIIIILNKKIE